MILIPGDPRTLNGNSVEDTCREGNQQEVVEECPKQVLFDVAHDPLAHPRGPNDIQGVAFHQNDIRGIDGDIPMN